jgi:hypothetical protein
VARPVIVKVAFRCGYESGQTISSGWIGLSLKEEFPVSLLTFRCGFATQAAFATFRVSHFRKKEFDNNNPTPEATIS